MGQSTDAILVFGIDFGEEPEHEFFAMLRDEDEDGDIIEAFDTFVNRELGIPGQGDDDYPGYKAAEEMRGKYPVTLVRHCSCDYPMYILAIPGTHVSASRGYPQTIDPDDMDIPRKKMDAFLNWCEKHGIDDDGAWLLCSDWC